MNEEVYIIATFDDGTSREAWVSPEVFVKITKLIRDEENTEFSEVGLFSPELNGGGKS